MAVHPEVSELLLPDIPDFACPSCHQPLVADQAGWRCVEEEIRFPAEDGIPSFLLPGRREALGEFLTMYQRIRKAEGWGNAAAQYYRELPYANENGTHGKIWRIRARTF